MTRWTRARLSPGTPRHAPWATLAHEHKRRRACAAGHCCPAPNLLPCALLRANREVARRHFSLAAGSKLGCVHGKNWRVTTKPSKEKGLPFLVPSLPLHAGQHAGGPAAFAPIATWMSCVLTHQQIPPRLGDSCGRTSPALVLSPVSSSWAAV